jgi:hypothetical protein
MGVHETLALPASEIASSKYPTAAAPTLQANEALPAAIEHRCCIGERHKLVDADLCAVSAREAVKKPHAIRLRSQTDFACALAANRLCER